MALVGRALIGLNQCCQVAGMVAPLRMLKFNIAPWKSCGIADFTLRRQGRRHEFNAHGGFIFLNLNNSCFGIFYPTHKHPKRIIIMTK